MIQQDKFIIPEQARIKSTINPFDNYHIYQGGTASAPKKYVSPSIPLNTGTETAEEILRREKQIRDILEKGMFVGDDKKTIKYKGVTLRLGLPQEAMEFFEDLKEITSDELRLLNLTFPEIYEKIKKEWVKKYTEFQAVKVFESD